MANLKSIQTQITKQKNQLEKILGQRAEVFHYRTYTWQESENGQKYQAKTDDLQKVFDDLEGVLDDLNPLI